MAVRSIKKDRRAGLLPALIRVHAGGVEVAHPLADEPILRVWDYAGLWALVAAMPELQSAVFDSPTGLAVLSVDREPFVLDKTSLPPLDLGAEPGMAVASDAAAVQDCADAAQFDPEPGSKGLANIARLWPPIGMPGSPGGAVAGGGSRAGIAGDAFDLRQWLPPLERGESPLEAQGGWLLQASCMVQHGAWQVQEPSPGNRLPPAHPVALRRMVFAGGVEWELLAVAGEAGAHQDASTSWLRLFRREGRWREITLERAFTAPPLRPVCQSAFYRRLHACVP